MLFFTADQHFGHKNIIKYCNRPFESVEEMDQVIIDRFNEVVSEGDEVIHVGDLTLARGKQVSRYVDRLNGRNTFLKGSHDYWQAKASRGLFPDILETKVEGQVIVACHYAMRVWPKSHYGAWQVYGHTHGDLPPQGKQWDVGVDNNDFYPVSFDQLKEIMEDLPDNFDLVED